MFLEDLFNDSVLRGVFLTVSLNVLLLQEPVQCPKDAHSSEAQ